MRYVFIVLFISFTSVVYSQTFIAGTVTDSTGQFLPKANIIVKHQSEILGYTLTNDIGYFEIQVPIFPRYQIKVTYLGYKPAEKTISNKEKLTHLSVVLKESRTKLKEIILNSNIPEIIQKKDTIIYNLSALTNGTESILKDIIEKLPGLAIDENGKIIANGKQIDKVLINGKEFFDKQHRLATENISSEMVKGIEFYKRYKSNFDNRSDSPLSALNVKLKDKYKNKITGNLILAIAYQKKYKLHPNIFNFRDKTNVAFIGDFNNLGQQAITLNDYMEFGGGIDNYIKGDMRPGLVELNEDELPEFLLKGNEVKNRKVYFGGLNLVYEQPKKMYFNGFYLSNFMQQTDQFTSQKNYWNGTTTKDANHTIGDYFILNTSSRFYYRFSQNNTLKLFITGNLQKDIAKGDVNFDSSDLKHETHNNYTTYGSKMKFSHIFNEDKIWGSELILNYKERRKNTNLSANYPIFNLSYPSNKYRFEHLTSKKFTDISLLTKYTQYYKRYHISYRLGSSWNKEILQTQNKFDIFVNDLDLNRQDYFFGINFQYNDLAFHLKSQIDFHHLNISLLNAGRQKSYNFLSPNINITYLFRLNHSLSLGYSFSNNVVTASKLLSNNNFLSPKTIYESNKIDKYLFPKNQIYLNYNNYVKKIKLYLDFNAVYIAKDKTISNKIIDATQKTTRLQYVVSPFEDAWNFLLSTNKSIFKHFYLSYNANFLLENKNSIYKNNTEKLENVMFHNILKLYSGFKKAPINFSLGLKYSLYQTSSQNSSQKNIYVSYRPFIKLKGKFYKKYFWTIKSSYDTYKFIGLEHYFNLSPSIEYQMSKYFYFSVIGNNILNLKNKELIQWDSNENFAEQKKIFNLSGYVSFQLKIVY